MRKISSTLEREVKSEKHVDITDKEVSYSDPPTQLCYRRDADSHGREGY